MFGGSGSPSAVRSAARRAGADFRPSSELGDAVQRQQPLEPIDQAGGVGDQTVALAQRPFAVLGLGRRHRYHAAVFLLAAQPTQERALQQTQVEPVGLRPPVLPRDRHARRMDDMAFDAARLQPTRQPEAVAAGLEGNRNPRDSAAGPDRLIPPAM